MKRKKCFVCRKIEVLNEDAECIPFNSRNPPAPLGSLMQELFDCPATISTIPPPLYALWRSPIYRWFPHKKITIFHLGWPKGNQLGPLFVDILRTQRGTNVTSPESYGGFLLMWNNSSQECNPPRASDPCPNGMSLTWLSIGMIISK